MAFCKTITDPGRRMAETVIFCVLLMMSSAIGLSAQDEQTYLASDSVAITAHVYARDFMGEHPIILAFHQAGANGRGEYQATAERLNDEGFDVVAVDMRSGGNRFGFTNITVDRIGDSSDYCDAAPDILGVLKDLHKAWPETPVFLWGSSFSAALVLRAAAEKPDGLAGVLAFSPASGGPMVDCRGEDVSAGITAPVLVLRPRSEMEIESLQVQADVFRKQGHQVFIADPGTHGSSMLVPERVDGDTEPAWVVVLDFMRDALKKTSAGGQRD